MTNLLEVGKYQKFISHAMNLVIKIDFLLLNRSKNSGVRKSTSFNHVFVMRTDKKSNQKFIGEIKIGHFVLLLG